MGEANEEVYDTSLIEQSLRQLIMKITRYYHRYDISEKYLLKFEDKLDKCEDIVEVIEIIREMFSTLMQQVTTITSEYLDISTSNNNINEIVKRYEDEIRQTILVVNEQQKYTAILENRIKEKDRLYLQVVSENKVCTLYLTKET